MDFFNKQPKELSPHDLNQICVTCNTEMNISEKQSALFRGQWYHVWCWKKLVGI